MTTKTIIMTLLIKRDISDMDFFSSSAMISDTASEFTDDVIGFIYDKELDEILERISRLGEDGKEKS